MKSFITDALTRAGPAGAAEPVQTQYGKSNSQEDEELTKILMSLRTNIKIIGCGGGGSNTIDRLYASNIKDADLYAANTDAQHLLVTRAHKKILLGRRSTRGLGAGALPQVGEEAAREAEEDLRKALLGADIVFITAGLGGGTGQVPPVHHRPASHGRLPQARRPAAPQASHHVHADAEGAAGPAART